MYIKWQIRFNQQLLSKAGQLVRRGGAARVPTSVGNPMYKKVRLGLTNKYAGMAQLS